MSDFLVKKKIVQISAILSKIEIENFIFIRVQGNIVF